MDNYVEVESQKNIDFPSEAAAGLFILMCSAIDEYRKEKYRYAYDYPKRIKGGKFQVTIKDFGE